MLYTQHNNKDACTFAEVCRIITTAQWRRATQFLEKYTSPFIWKGCMWEGVGDRTELLYIDPHSTGHNRVSFPFSWAAQPGASRLTLLSAAFLYRILSPTGLVSKLSIGGPEAPSAGCWLSLPHLVTNGSGLQTDFISNCNNSIGGLRAHSAGCWLSLPHLVSNRSGLQTNWFPVFTELYNSSTSTFLWASQIALIQPIHGQGYNILIDRMHLLFTKVHFLFW